VTLNSVVAGEESMAADLLTLDRCWTPWRATTPRAAQVMELTYFIGLPRNDIAELLGHLSAHGGP
jgi:hypothetical protein